MSLSLSEVTRVIELRRELEKVETVINSGLAYWCYDDSKFGIGGTFTYVLFGPGREKLGEVFGHYAGISRDEAMFSASVYGSPKVATFSGYCALGDAKEWLERETNVQTYKSAEDRAADEQRRSMQANGLGISTVTVSTD